MDIWVNPTEQNSQRVMAVLDEFGFGELELDASDFVKPRNVIQLGYPPMCIDLLTRPDGVDFTQCVSRQLDVDHDGLTIHVIGLKDFKDNKLASGRPKDIEDLRNLQDI